MFSTSRYEIHVCFSTVVRCGLLGVCERTRLFSSYLLVCLFVCMLACACVCLLAYFPIGHAKDGRCSWLLLAALGCSCLLLVSSGWFWLLLGVPGCSRLLGFITSLSQCETSTKPVRNQCETQYETQCETSRDMYFTYKSTIWKIGLALRNL